LGVENGSVLENVILNEVKNLVLSKATRSFALLRMTQREVFNTLLREILEGFTNKF
jgi:hypothetical protein